MADAVRHPVADLRGRTTAVIETGGAPHAPDWQVVAFGSVWVSNEPRGLVQRIDPKTDRIVDAIRVDVPCSGLAAGFGSVWVPDCGSPSIVRIDARTDRVIDEIPTSLAARDTEGEGSIVAGAGGVWFLSDPFTLSRLDPATGEVEDVADVPGGSYTLAVGFGSIWTVSGPSGTVTRVDPSGDIRASIDVGPSPRFIAAGEGAVWVIDQGDGTVARIDPATNAMTPIDAASPGEGGCITTGLGSVWLTVPGEPLTRIDPNENVVAEQFLGKGGDCLSVGYGSVWLSNHDLGNLWRIRPG
jgi:virginiamycin B lyase